MTVAEFVEAYPSFSGWQPSAKEHWEDVARQAKQHTKRNNKTYLFKKARPTEDEVIREYREENVRNLTKSVVNSLIAKLARITKNSNIAVDENSLNPALADWLVNSPFDFNGQKMDFYEYLFFALRPTH